MTALMVLTPRKCVCVCFFVFCFFWGFLTKVFPLKRSICWKLTNRRGSGLSFCLRSEHWLLRRHFVARRKSENRWVCASLTSPRSLRRSSFRGNYAYEVVGSAGHFRYDRNSIFHQYAVQGTCSDIPYINLNTKGYLIILSAGCCFGIRTKWETTDLPLDRLYFPMSGSWNM